MATIALYAGKLNQMPSLINEVKKSVNDYSSELFSLKSKALKIRKSVCDLDDVIGMVQASTQLQDQKIESLEAFCQKTEEFISDTVRIDEEAAAVINQSKEDFYNQYNYLRPDAEKSDWEAFWDNAAEWCAEHWKEIVTTATIIIGAALAIAVVVMTGGAALVPLLSTLLTAIGVSAGTAMTAATIISFTVAVIAVGSTIGSSALNIIDTWGNIDNPTFNTWQSVLNWTSIISNGLYSVGNIYNSVQYKFGRKFDDVCKRDNIVVEQSNSFSTAKNYGIDIDNLNFSNTVRNHIGRPYQESKLLINEIIESKPPISDPRGTNAWSWIVEGTFNGSTGYYELIIDPRSNTVWHFLFKSQ